MRLSKKMGGVALLTGALLVGSAAMAFASYGYNLNVPGGGGFATSAYPEPASSLAPYYYSDFQSASPSRAMNFALANANGVVQSAWNGQSPGTNEEWNGASTQGEEVKLAVGSALLTYGSTNVVGNYTP